MVSNHVMDLIERYGFDGEIPATLTDYVKARSSTTSADHSRVGAKHDEFVTDEIQRPLSACSGTPEQVTKKLKELEAIGVTQFNIYLMTHSEETLAAYGKDVIPQFTRVAAWAISRDDQRWRRSRRAHLRASR